MAERYELRQRNHSARMISVKMTQHEMVYARKAGGLRDFEDALRIPVVALPSCVVEQRLAGRGDHQRCGAPLDVDPIDIERAVLRGCAVGKESHQRDSAERLQPFHRIPL